MTSLPALNNYIQKVYDYIHKRNQGKGLKNLVFCNFITNNYINYNINNRITAELRKKPFIIEKKNPKMNERLETFCEKVMPR